MQVARFALLGLSTGGIYALLALGVVLVYRGSGLLNFSQGALATFGAYWYYELSVRLGIDKYVAALIALMLCALLGAAIQLFLLRTMRRRSASPLAQEILTLSILLILQAIPLLIYGSYPLAVPSLLPTQVVHVFSSQIAISVNYLYIVGISLVLAAALFVVYKRTSFGRLTAAVAEDELTASSLGHSPDLVAALNWAVGAVLAGIAGILIAPILNLDPTSIILLVVPALAAALVGNFASFPIVLLAALGLGVAESEISRYVSEPGWSTAVPFLVVVGYMAVRGRVIPLRGFTLDRLPSTGNGRIRPAGLLVVAAAGMWLAFSASANWDASLVSTCGAAIVCLSIVMLTGYAGQLSLAQYVIAGVGAFVAAKLVAHMALVPAVLLATVITGVVGVVVGSPALRTRGATLAVATLGLASSIVAVVFSNSGLSGGLGGIVVPSLSIFGWSIDPILHPSRYAAVALALALLIGASLANIRRSSTGSELMAVRANERAAASVGVSVAGVKIYAFFVGAAIAGVGGIVLAFAQPTVQPANFDIFTSILLVGLTVIGGVGYLPGAFFGALLLSGGLTSQLLSGWAQADKYLPVIGAFGLLITLLATTDGWVATAATTVNRFAALIPWRHQVPWARPGQADAHDPHAVAQPQVSIPPISLTVRDVSIRFGGVLALSQVSLDVKPGEVHGLIGPNGAGKTTLIDVITGFASGATGVVTLGDTDISGWNARRRSQAGLARCFQSLELFNDLTVEQNLAVASQQREAWRYVADPIWPGKAGLAPAARAAVIQFGLEDILSVEPSNISFGRRKLVAIARAVASGPAILLLDEPAAGLGDSEVDDLSARIRTLANQWGVGVLLVEHKVDMIMSLSDRITVLREGVVIASGTPAEIRAHADVIDAYLGGGAPVAYPSVTAVSHDP